MKQFFKMFFASLLAMVVAGVILIGIFIAAIVGLVSRNVSPEKENKLESKSVLTIDLNQRLHEQGESNSFASFSNDQAYSAGLYDVTRSIEAAANDNKISGILLKLDNSPNGWATLEQIRIALEKFKNSHKFIYAYGEGIPQKAYYLATVADAVYLNPVGAIELKGLASQIMFFKKTLEKLDVQPEIFYAGKFKSATEPFRAEKISDANRIQINELQHDIWSSFLNAAAQHTHTDTAAIQQLTLNGTIQFPADALKYKLVDGLLYWDQVEALIRKQTGQKEDSDINYVSVDEYASNVRNAGKYKDERIAVLFAEGDITDGHKNDDYQIASEDLVETIRDIRKNDKIKAVVMRVNSPGGSALASEVILRELQLLQKKKPLIVSMGDLAASGGYYISCQADSIFAMPTTITGSIGVFSMLFSTEGLLKNKLGINTDVVKNAPYADVPTFTRTLNANEGQRIQNGVDMIYSVFKSRVAQGRKIDPAMVDSIAQGRVWSGTDALAIHLVDGLGGLDRAIKSAAAKANIKEFQVVTYPEPVDKLESLIRRFNRSNVSAAAMSEVIKSEMGQDYQWYKQVKDLCRMNGHTQMALPYKFTID